MCVDGVSEEAETLVGQGFPTVLNERYNAA